MKKLIIFILFTIPISILGQAEIVGGEDANIEDYPYQVALGNSSGGSFFWAYCGASIINEYWILTAAHCVQGEMASNTAVRVGSDNDYAQGGTIYDAEQIISHPNYSNNGNNWDIALIKLEDPINFNENTQPVLLPCQQQVDLGVEDPGQMAWVTGWGNTEGTTNSSQLQVVGVPITTESNYWGGVNDDEIMAGYPDGGYDSCQGDSGGPMVVLAADGETFLQVGIVSWGSGCAEPGYPGVYSRVSYFIDWICENTNGDVCANESEFCNEDAVYGCTDNAAENYNPDATADDGSCEYIYGCTDNAAENYNPDATADDGSCEYACDNTVSLYLVLDCYGEEISWELTSSDSGNIIDYVSEETYPGGSTAQTMEEGGSIQEQEICLSEGCYVFTITDSYGDGLTGSEFSCEIDGTPFSITDQNGTVLFEETNPAFGDCEAGGENGPCSASYSFCVTGNNEVILGCTDPNANNYNADANTDDGSCIIEGCTDGGPAELGFISACNYDETATVEDGSCEYLSCAGCTDENFLEYDSTATIDDGSCETEIVLGCVDETAENYNPDANTNDGSCEYSYSWQACSNQMWFEDFENYSTNSNIDDQSNEWFGWDNVNSNVEVISNGFNNSNQSILVEQDDDIVHSFGGIENGVGEVVFWMYIPSDSGAGAYYNMLHDYNTQDPNNSIWAHQITFASAESGDQSVLDAAGYGVAYFDAIYDTWIEVRQEIDLDNDYTTLYYNGNELYSWQFSQDAGGQEQLNILDAINFYGYCAGNGCVGQAWYDNIEICGFDNTTSIIENDNIWLELYPNPNSGQFHMSFNKNIDALFIQITDVLGKIIYSEEIENYTANTQKKINISQQKGTYILSIKSSIYNNDKLILIE